MRWHIGPKQMDWNCSAGSDKSLTMRHPIKHRSVTQIVWDLDRQHEGLLRCSIVFFRKFPESGKNQVHQGRVSRWCGTTSATFIELPCPKDIDLLSRRPFSRGTARATALNCLFRLLEDFCLVTRSWPKKNALPLFTRPISRHLTETVWWPGCTSHFCKGPPSQSCRRGAAGHETWLEPVEICRAVSSFVPMVWSLGARTCSHNFPNPLQLPSTKRGIALHCNIALLGWFRPYTRILNDLECIPVTMQDSWMLFALRRMPISQVRIAELVFAFSPGKENGGQTVGQTCLCRINMVWVEKP